MSTKIEELLGKKFDQVIADPLASAWGKSEIEKIDRTLYLNYRGAGVSFLSEKARKVITIFLYSKSHGKLDGYPGFQGYAGELPFELNFKDTRRDVRRKLGKPSESGGGVVLPVLGKSPPFDQYSYDSLTINIDYLEVKGSISRITLMLPEAVVR